MASLSRNKAECIRILFQSPTDGKRKTIYLGKTSKKHAEAVKQKVESLVSARAAGVPDDPHTAAWTATIPADLAAKLAAVGLMAARPKAVTLGELLALYAAEKEADNKPGTRLNYDAISNDLTGFFGADADPRRLTDDDGRRFLDHLRERGLAGTTVARRVRRCRSVCEFAAARQLMPANPFAGVKAASTPAPGRQAYLPAADAVLIMGCASPVWRIILALSRFAGMRCPSEVLSLRWDGTDLAAGRMTVHSPKTEGTPGKESRVCPIFPALRPYLEEAARLAPPGAEYVVSGRLGDRGRETARGPKAWKGVNLRAGLCLLIRRAGLKPWPKLFTTLRASCETDLLRQFPISAVTEWIGHSPAIALKHYARVPDDVFEQAAGMRDAEDDAEYDADRSGHNATGSDRLGGSACKTGFPSAPGRSCPVRSPGLRILPGFQTPSGETRWAGG